MYDNLVSSLRGEGEGYGRIHASSINEKLDDGRTARKRGPAGAETGKPPRRRDTMAWGGTCRQTAGVHPIYHQFKKKGTESRALGG